MIASHKSYPCTALYWPDVVSDVLSEGHKVESRVGPTLEIINASMQFSDPTKRYINPPGRNINLPFAIIDTVEILLGRNPGNVNVFNSQMTKFINPDTGMYDGGYGGRIMLGGLNQFRRVYNELKSSKDSRRAILVINNPLIDNFNGVDVACTMYLQFIQRDGALHLITNMRSNDVFLGFCYDTFTFQFFQEVMACLLGFRTGRYVHNSGSLHFYIKNKDQFDKINPFNNKIYEEYRTAAVTSTSIDNFYSDLKVIDFLGTLFAMDVSASREIEVEFATQLLRIKDGYMRQCALVIIAEYYRRRSVIREYQIYSDMIDNEFKHYFKTKMIQNGRAA